MAKSKPRATKPPPPKVGMWHAISNIAVASINKGQFGLAILGAVMIVALVKMPGEDVSKLVFRILEDLEKGELWSWIVAASSLTGWFLHARIQRRVITKEMDRIALLRNKLQQKLLDGNISSSNE